MSRNLVEYPITKEEVLKVVADAAYDALAKSGVGGLQSYILDCVHIVVDREFKSEDFNPMVGE